MAEEEQLRRMVMTFRVSELQMLLGYAGKNKTGRKNELQNRALELVKVKSNTINQKIRELYKSIQQEMMSFGDRSQGPAPGINANIIANQRASSTFPQNCLNTSQSATTYSRPSTNSGSHSTSGYPIQSSHNSSYPISPDVRLKELPFFDILGELLKPCTLAPHGSGRYQEGSFSFSLTPQQANKIAHSRDLRPGKQDYSVQVQMRFCLLETTCEQDDNFPPNLSVKINEKACPLPTPIPTTKAGVEPKRPSRPVNVTGLCKISPTVANRILVSWSSEYGRCYVISVYLVQKLTSEDLLQRLKTKGPRLADFTKSLIKQKMMEDGECEIATTSLRCSLLCPLGKMRMMLPCRAETCNHLQCFDASLYLQMNERKPTWTCPVCDKTALYNTLVIDGYFQDVLQENTSCTEVTLNKDGSWTPLTAKKEQKEPQQEKKKSEVAVETLSDDSDDDDDDDDGSTKDSGVEEVRNKRKAADVEIITLSDSDGEEPETKRPNRNPTPEMEFKGDPTKEENSLSSVKSQECSISNDSWHVGEVEPGKRLVFRKSLSNSSGEVTANQSSSKSKSYQSSPSQSPSPPIICLDSPQRSPTSPSDCTVPASQVATEPTQESVETSSSSVPTRNPPPYSATSLYPSESGLLGCTLEPVRSDSSSTTSSLPHASCPVTITPVPPKSISPAEPSHTAASSTPYMVDPLSTPTYISSPALGGAPYNLGSNLQSLFNPLGLIPPPPTSNNSPTDYSNFRPDRYL